MGKRLPTNIPIGDSPSAAYRGNLDRNLNSLEDRLRRQAQQSGASQETLRGLLEETGIYDGYPGGIDAVIAKAERAAADNTANPPATGLLGATVDRKNKTITQFDIPYRTLFPEVDYGRVDEPVDVFFSPNPMVHGMNSYFSSGMYGQEGTVAQNMDAAKYAAIKHQQKVRDMYRLASAEADQVPNVPFEAAIEAQRVSSEGTPRHIVMGTMKNPDGTNTTLLNRKNFYPTLLHEVGHHGHGGYDQTLYEQKLLPPGRMLDNLLDQMHPTVVAMPDLHPNEALPMDVLSDMDSQDNADEWARAADLYYRSKPVEADQMLADIKRDYFANTGRLVDTPEEAEKALERFVLFNDRSPSGALLDTVATPHVAEFYKNPQSFGNDANRDMYLRRMMELFGFGAPLLLRGLTDDDDNRRQQQLSY